MGNPKKMLVFERFSFLDGTFVLEVDALVVCMLLLVMAVFGYCIVGMALQRELLLFLDDGYFDNKNVLLLIAHPDDESMFFSPLLCYLSRRDSLCSIKLHLLSLSNGGNSARSQELKNAAMRVFGMKKERIKVINDERRLKDDINTNWNADAIIEYVNEYVEANGIDIVFSFDEHGISQHPNHCSIHRALRQSQSIMDGAEVYSLRTVSICRKYSIYFEALLNLLICAPFNWNLSKSDFVILSAPNKCWNAMSHHKSQFVWFRKAFVALSRYSWINEFDKMNAPKKTK